MIVNNQEVRFQLDSGADVNTLCERYVYKDQVRPTPVKLKMWNKSEVVPLGQTHITVTNPKNGLKTDVQFIVVPNQLSCLLGLETLQKMNLLEVKHESFIASVTSEHGLGDLGEVSLTVDPAIHPKAMPSRNLPLALQSAVKDELDRLVQLNVLEPVTEPTKWCSQMAVVKKPSGKIRICIDPSMLNEALQREYYKLPTLDEVKPKLQGARVFSS